jgi:peptide/nickel transport system substrate-binding protein
MQIYRANLRKLGIEINVREMTWDSLWEKSKSESPANRQDLLVMAWYPDYPSPMSWFSSLIHSEDDIVFNLAYIRDAELDGMIEDADRYAASDRPAAVKLLSEIQRRVIGEGYMLFMYDHVSEWVYSEKISGFADNPAYDGVVFYYDLRMK